MHVLVARSRRMGSIGSYVVGSTLFSTLLAGGHVQAQAPGPAPQGSHVTLWGLVDGGYYRRKLAGEPSSSGLDGGLMTVSRWGLRGSEDLGGGLSANFELTSHFRTGSGETGRHAVESASGRQWTQASWVGLRGGFGQVRLGRIPTHSFVNGIRFSALGNSTTLGPYLMHAYSGGQPMISPNSGADGVWNNVISYNTPTLRGFTATFMATPRKNGSEGKRMEGTVSYGMRGRGFSAALGHIRVDDASYIMPRTPTDPQGVPYVIQAQRTTNAHAAYDFGVTKLGAQFMKSRLRPQGLASIDLKTYSVGATVPQGTNRFVVSLAHTVRSQAGVERKKRSTLTAGYVYRLSKQTDLYGFAIADRATDLSSGVGYAAGMQHRF